MASEEKRQIILTVTAKLLLKQGLRGTSMEAIARAAGIAKPTLYAYFPDKTAVYFAIVEQLIASWHQTFGLAMSGDSDIVQRVGAALTAKHKAVMQLLAGSPHAADLYGEHQHLVAAQFHAYESETAITLEAHLTRAGVVRARMVTQLLLASAHGIGQKAQSPAELGPALRLLAERLIRPELPT